MKKAFIILGLALVATTASFSFGSSWRMRTVIEPCVTPLGEIATRTLCYFDGSDACAFKDCGMWGSLPFPF